jgi:ribonuclease P/MRP protein subunit RPP1
MKQLVLKQNLEFEKKLDIKTEIVEVINVQTNKFRSAVQKSKGLVIIKGGNEKINRLAVENKQVDILLSPEDNNRKDSFFIKKSGINQVMCRLAKANGVSIGINFSDLLNSTGKERIVRLGRMIQNVKICKKFGVNIVIGTFAENKYELRSDDCLKSFAKVLGMDNFNVKKLFIVDN